MWSPDTDAPRDLDSLARYVDEQLQSLSRALDTFKIFAETYAPVWGHTVSNAPVIGNGVLQGHSMRWGDIALVQIFLSIGSTTTFEAAPTPGGWTFSLPWAADGDLSEYVGHAYLLDTGTTTFAATARIINQQDVMSITPENNASVIESTNPMAWAVGDRMEATIMYPVRD